MKLTKVRLNKSAHVIEIGRVSIIYTVKKYTIKSLQKNQDFRRVYARGRSVAGKNLVLYCLCRNHGLKRFGFSVSKKTGKAVVRNRIKRVLREICRLHGDYFKEGYDYIVIPRRGAIHKSYQVLKEEMLRLAQKIK